MAEFNKQPGSNQKPAFVGHCKISLERLMIMMKMMTTQMQMDGDYGHNCCHHHCRQHRHCRPHHHQYLTNTMKQSSSWEADRFSASQENSCIKWGPKVNYHIHKSLQPVPELSQINPGNDLPSNFLIHFNIIHPSKPGSSKSSLSPGFPHQNPVCTPPLPHMCYMPHPSYSSLFDHPNNIWWRLHIT